MNEKEIAWEKIRTTLEALAGFVSDLNPNSNSAEIALYSYACKQLDQEIKNLFRSLPECEEIENHYRSLNLGRALESPNELKKDWAIYVQKLAQINIEMLSIRLNQAHPPEESIVDWNEETAINFTAGLLLYKDKTSKITYSEGKFYLNGKSFYGLNKSQIKEFWDFAESRDQTILEENELSGYFGGKGWYKLKDAISRQHRSYLLEKVRKAYTKEGVNCPDFSKKCLSFTPSKGQIKLWRL